MEGCLGVTPFTAEAIERMMGRTVTFGRRYNLTGSQFYSDDGYIDTLAAAVGVEPRKVNVPSEVMDALWDGDLTFALGGGARPTMNIRSTDSAQHAQSARRAICRVRD